MAFVDVMATPTKGTTNNNQQQEHMPLI